MTGSKADPQLRLEESVRCSLLEQDLQAEEARIADTGDSSTFATWNVQLETQREQIDCALTLLEHADRYAPSAVDPAGTQEN